MKTPILVAALLLAVPLTASAQYDPVMVQAYYAALQIQHDDQEGADPLVRLRDAMWTAHNYGIYPPNFPRPWEIRTDYEMEERTEGTGCFYYYDDEAGEWRERCSEYRTYRCNTVSQIEDLQSAQNGANWFAAFYGSAAWYAGAVGHRPAQTVFGGLAAFFTWTSLYAEHRLAQMELNRCERP